MALPLPGGLLVSTREIRVNKVNVTDHTAELAYEVKHEDGSVDACWGIHLINLALKQQYAELELETWMSRPVHIGAITAPFGNASIGITQMQLIDGDWIKPHKDGSSLRHS